MYILINLIASIVLVAGVLGTAVLIALLLTLLGLYKAYWLHILWVWFCVPLGLPNLSVLTIFGILVIINILTAQFKIKPTRPTKEMFIDLLAWLLGLPAAVLGVYLARLFLS